MRHCEWQNVLARSSPPEVLLGKGVLKICSKFTGEHPCRSVMFIDVHKVECSPVNLLLIFRTTFPKNTYEGLLLTCILFKFEKAKKFKILYQGFSVKKATEKIEMKMKTMCWGW